MFSEAIKAFIAARCGTPRNDDELKKSVAKLLHSGELSAARFDELMTGRKERPMSHNLNPETLLANGARRGHGTERTVLKHRKTGLPVFYNKRPVEDLSELEYAKCGVFLRSLALKAGIAARPLSDGEHELLNGMVDNDPWCGVIGEQHYDAISGKQVKALISDSTSGGVNLNPVWFDTAITTFPLLSGELLPYVDVKEMPRAATANTASVNTPTVVWGTEEGTSQSLFSTSSMVAQIAASTFPVQVLIEVGRDMLSDSPVDVGATLVDVVTERMKAELDKVIATGNGTTQPQGLSNASGLTSVSSISGVGGPLFVGDAENLIFSIGKQYRTPSLEPAFAMNDTNYLRLRSTPINAADERRVFGMDHQSYRLLDYPVRIANDLNNNTILFGCLRKYRLWRRSGFEVRWTQEGVTLARTNTAVLVVRGRYAGKVLDGSAFGKMTSAPN